MPTDRHPDETERLHATVGDLLADRGHRYTSSRRRIVTALHQADAPLSLPQLLDTDGRLAQSSAYRNLVILEEVGVAVRLMAVDDHARYELDERVTRHHHHHLICTDCGDVQDFELPATVEASLEDELDRAGQAAAFRIERHRLDLIGVCASCS